MAMGRGPVAPWCNIFARRSVVALISIAVACGRAVEHKRGRSSPWGFVRQVRPGELRKPSLSPKPVPPLRAESACTLA
jgi:hypothetical protein